MPLYKDEVNFYLFDEYSPVYGYSKKDKYQFIRDLKKLRKLEDIL